MLGDYPRAIRAITPQHSDLEVSHSSELWQATTFHLTANREVRYAPVGGQMKQKSDVLQGTLDLLVLRTLDVMGAMHGYGIAQRIQQISEDVLQLNQGTLYPALLRLEQQGWVQSKWGVSENNRRARYYSVTRSGRKQLAEERASWDRVSGAIKRLLEAGA